MNGNNVSPSVWLESPAGERFPLSGRCFLGRSPLCEVVLPDSQVSRQHALVQSQDEREFWLIDMGSVNGTYLNGRRVSQPCRLSNGDRIAIAEFTLTFHSPKPPAPLPSAQLAAYATDSSDATVQAVRSLPCWLLVADLEGSTQLLQRLSAEEAPRVIGRWLATCRKIIEDQRGTLNKFLGDGFLAYWPAGPQCASWVASTLLAFKKLQEEGPTRFRVIVHYGQISTGGAGSMGEESLSGNEVNLVFRVEKVAAAIGQFRLLTEPAKTGLAHALTAVPAGRHAVPGFDGEFALFSF